MRSRSLVALLTLSLLLAACGSPTVTPPGLTLGQAEATVTVAILVHDATRAVQTASPSPTLQGGLPPANPRDTPPPTPTDYTPPTFTPWPTATSITHPAPGYGFGTTYSVGTWQVTLQQMERRRCQAIVHIADSPGAYAIGAFYFIWLAARNISSETRRLYDDVEWRMLMRGMPGVMPLNGSGQSGSSADYGSYIFPTGYDSVLLPVPPGQVTHPMLIFESHGGTPSTFGVGLRSRSSITWRFFNLEAGHNPAEGTPIPRCPGAMATAQVGQARETLGREQQPDLADHDVDRQAAVRRMCCSLLTDHGSPL